jgi:adenylyltransferase/sulfurtransferase
MSTADDLARYHRQMLIQGIGEHGQRRLAEARVLVVGCGALGSVGADMLARAGVGYLRIVDRDIVDETNLQRQVLFDEDDVARDVPKAEAAKTKLGRINSQVTIDAHVDDFNHRNAQQLAEGIDLLFDGLDNFQTRYLLNDLAVKTGRPYVYGGAVGTTGMSMPILPQEWTREYATPCLACIFPQAPPPGTSPTCDTVGVLAPVVAAVAAHQVAQTLKLLTGNVAAVDRTLLSIDLWSNTTSRLDVGPAPTTDACRCCGQRHFEYLQGESQWHVSTLCGRNAVQIVPGDDVPPLPLESLAAKLTAHGRFKQNEYLLHGQLDQERGPQGMPIELTLFPNGRAIVKGTTEPEIARSIYARYVGS